MLVLKCCLEDQTIKSYDILCNVFSKKIFECSSCS